MAKNEITINDKSYKLLKMLGEGGQGKVYHALTSENDSVAIKFLDLPKDEVARKAYMREVELLVKLQYTNKVVKLIDYEVHKNSILGDTLYVVMEKGDTDFDKYLRKRSRSGLSDTLMIRFHWAEMLKAMQVVHNEGVVHSDLKPYNFLLVGGELKLIDFGLASVVARERTSVTRDLLGGTPFYMSPESFKGLADPELGAKIKVTVKSDVWSLGCILYEMLYGQTPFEHMRGKQLFDAILNDQTFIEYKQGPDPSLINIVKTCLQRNPADRPTVDELLDNKCDLDALKNSPPMARKSETVLLFGGLVDGNISDEIREYNMTTESTSVLNIKMKRARFWHSVGLNKWANELVIAGGGNTTNNAELCTLAMNKNSFSFVELPNLNKERYGASSCVLDGRFYLFGGYTKGFLKHCEYFDFTKRTWNAIADLPVKLGLTRSNAIARPVAGNEGSSIFLFGGYDGTAASNEVYEYHVKDNRWQRRHDLKLAQPLSYCACVSLKKDVITVCGGETGYTTTSPSKQCYSLDLNSKVWHPLPPMNVARHSHQGVVVNGEILVIGGIGTGDHHLKSVEKFNGKRWTVLKDLDEPIASFAAVVNI